MKAIKCCDMGGVCDVLIKGNTATEIALRASAHYSKMSDKDHQAVILRINSSSPEEVHAWRTEFQKQFDAADEINES